jgi:hypothetical protein
MSSSKVVFAAVHVLGELIILKSKNDRKWKKSIWVRKWIQRRNLLGVSNTLIRELALEDS